MVALDPSATEAARWPCRRPEATARSKGPRRFQCGTHMSARRRPPSSTPPWSSGRGGRKFAFSISGCNPAALARAAKQVAELMAPRNTITVTHTRTNSGVIPKRISCPITKRASDVTPGNREPKAHPHHHCVKKEQAPHEAPELELGIDCGHAPVAGCCKSCK